MFTGNEKIGPERDIIALVELDIQTMRVRFVLAREAIKERMRELEHTGDHHGKHQDVPDGLEKCHKNNEPVKHL
jgi:hypothetical protein